MISAQITKGQNLPAELRAVLPKVNSAVEVTVYKLALKMTSLVKTKLSGDVLKVKTGNLRSSIHPQFVNTDSSKQAIIGTNVKYAKTHEYGLTIPAHEINPKNAKALSFNWNGAKVAFKRVRIPAVQMPERSFLRSSLEEMTPEIRQALFDAVKNEFKGVKK